MPGSPVAFDQCMPSWELSLEKHLFSLVLKNASKTSNHVSVVFCRNKKQNQRGVFNCLKTFLNLLQALALYNKGPSITCLLVYNCEGIYKCF